LHGLSRLRLLGKSIIKNNLFKRNAILPSMPFELWLRSEVSDIPEAEVGHRDNVFRDVKHLAKPERIENADPAHANALCACGQRFWIAQTVE
jgi:hypothetical protein